MNNQVLSLKSGRQRFARSQQATQFLFALLLLASLSLKAQTYQASSRTDYVYPPFPTAYNGLHQDETKYLSNASYPSIRYGGDFVFASGWSSDVDGGFTAGTMDAGEIIPVPLLSSYWTKSMCRLVFLKVRPTRISW